MKQKRMLCLLLLGFGLSAANAQEAVTVSGGDALGTGGSAAYSVGQVFFTSGVGTGGTLAQGVQQPYEIFSVGVKEETKMIIFLSVYPNPTMDKLTLQVGDYQNQKLSYHLFDLSGKLLETKSLTEAQTQLNTSDLVPAIYFLNITEHNNTIKSFKIIKN
jgi:hypothetical protein